jgi:monoamine oxidase
MKQLEELEHDMPILEFLKTRFPGEEHKELRESALQFIEGYNAADSTRASSFALREEWGEEDDRQGRIDEGYVALANYLADEIKKRGNEILLSQVVDKVNWTKGKVELTTTDNRRYTASKLLVTIPLGVWQAQGQVGHISFFPALTGKVEAAQKMGFGGVIKINLQFENNFWEEEAPNQMKNAGFIFSDGELPTWWTQEPVKNGQLTGWIAGPRAAKLNDASEEEIFQQSVKTLAYVFGTDENFIEERLVAFHITNWIEETFSRGAYSYATLDTHWAKDVLAEPVEQTIYFAGEALYKGTETGTVEGALANGREVAHQIIAES